MNKNFNIFVIYNSYLNSKSGSNTHILELISNLNKLCNVTLFAPKNKGAAHCINKINVPVSGNIYLDVIFYQFSLFFYLIYYCFVNKPNILYNRQDNLSMSSLIISKIFNIPYIVEVNGLLTEEAKIYKRPSVFIRLLGVCEKLNYNHCSKIICVTEGIKQEILKLYNLHEEKIIVINNGANINLFCPMNKKASQKKVNLDFMSMYVCFVGRLIPWQGLEYLIQAAPNILKKFPNTNFLIVGDGPVKEELIELARSLGVLHKFIFTGAVSYDYVPFYINSSDICVAPFINKRNAKIGLSALKMYEYMACGKPIVASNIRGVGDLLRKSYGGIDTVPESSRDLEEGIIKLIENEKLREDLGNNGLKYVLHNHTWEIVATKIISVCQETISECERYSTDRRYVNYQT